MIRLRMPVCTYCIHRHKRVYARTRVYVCACIAEVAKHEFDTSKCHLCVEKSNENSECVKYLFVSCINERTQHQNLQTIDAKNTRKPKAKIERKTSFPIWMLFDTISTTQIRMCFFLYQYQREIKQWFAYQLWYYCVRSSNPQKRIIFIVSKQQNGT